MVGLAVSGGLMDTFALMWYLGQMLLHGMGHA